MGQSRTATVKTISGHDVAVQTSVEAPAGKLRGDASSVVGRALAQQKPNTDLRRYLVRDRGNGRS